MENDKICEVGHFLNFHLKFFWSTNLNQNWMQSKKNLYYIAYIINMPIIPWIIFFKKIKWY